MKTEEKKLPYSKSSKIPKISVTELKFETGSFNYICRTLITSISSWSSGKPRSYFRC